MRERDAQRVCVPFLATESRQQLGIDAGQRNYVLAETLGATFTAQWVVSFNGDFAGCGTPCPTDLNGDGVTGSADLSILLNGWGGTSPDLNGDGSVGSADLSVLLNGWGACP